MRSGGAGGWSGWSGWSGWRAHTRVGKTRVTTYSRGTTFQIGLADPQSAMATWPAEPSQWPRGPDVWVAPSLFCLTLLRPYRYWLESGHVSPPPLDAPTGGGHARRSEPSQQPLPSSLQTPSRRFVATDDKIPAVATECGRVKALNALLCMNSPII